MHLYDFDLKEGPCLRLSVAEPIFDSVQSGRLVDAYLPGCTVHFEGDCERAPDVYLSVRRCSPRFFYSESQVELYSDASGDALLLDVLHLMYGIARLHWFKQGVFPVHAACVGKTSVDNTLIVGHSGAGKTSVALNLANARGYKIFSGNKTLVKIGPPSRLLRAIAGTPTITIKAEDAKAHGRSATKYGQRATVSVSPNLLSKAHEVRIGKIVLVRLNDGAAECAKLSALSALHTLYPFFLDAVNADVVVGGGIGVLSGDSGPHVREFLCLELQRVTRRMPVYKISGSMNFVVESILAAE